MAAWAKEAGELRKNLHELRLLRMRRTAEGVMNHVIHSTSKWRRILTHLIR